MNIVLMAGGGGTRLWPLSREKTPKQFMDLGGGKTLVAQSLDRALQLTDLNHIYVATREDYADLITQNLPDISSDHIFYEPEKRDTTAAFASICLRLAQTGQGHQPTIFMWADHVFSRQPEFLADLQKIPDLLTSHPHHLIIVGHTVLFPDTSLGYIETGRPIAGQSNVFHVAAFKEKPDLPAAEKFTADRKYFWNLGYFSLYPDYLLTELTRQSPDIKPALEAYQTALSAGHKAGINQAYSAFPKISLEYTLIEKTDRIIAITGDYGWSDVGNWAAVKKIFGADGDHMPSGHHVHVNCHNNYIYNATNKTVSMLGIKDTIVVVTEDAILITSPDHAPHLKKVVTKLKEDNQTDVL